MATCDPENDQILNITSAEQAEQSLAYFGHECPVDTKEYTDLLGSIGLEQILECDEMNEDIQRGDSKKPLYKSQLVDAINSKIEQIQRKNLGDSFEDDQIEEEKKEGSSSSESEEEPKIIATEYDPKSEIAIKVQKQL